MTSVSAIEYVWNIVPEPVKKVCTEISSRWEEFGKQIQNWTHKNLPPQYVDKADRLFNAIPFIALTLILPLSWSVCLLAVGYIADIAVGPFSRDFYNNLYNGIGVGTSLLTVSSAFEFLSNPLNPLNLLATFIYGYVTTFILPKGNLFA